VTPAVNIREVSSAEIEPLLPLLEEDQMGIEPGVGQWLAAVDDQGVVIGVARVTTVGGHRTIDDVLVRPEHQGRGIATALLEYASSPIWLICDDDMIAFYEARGFAQAKPEEFPEPLATLYAARGEWPFPTDHVHYAMVRE
jgi:GNAT superfamily N-acetyltransferase